MGFNSGFKGLSGWRLGDIIQVKNDQILYFSWSYQRNSAKCFGNCGAFTWLAALIRTGSASKGLCGIDGKCNCHIERNSCRELFGHSLTKLDESVFLPHPIYVRMDIKLIDSPLDIVSYSFTPLELMVFSLKSCLDECSFCLTF